MSNPVLEKIFTKYPRASRENLIPILQDVQESDGYLSREAIQDISRYLKLPSSKVYGVATFYNQFRFHPTGRFHIQLCRGTACHVNGSAKLLEAVKKILKVEPGQTTKDKMWSLETVACMGACGLSPVICINGEFHAKVTPKLLVKILDQYRAEEARHAGK